MDAFVPKVSWFLIKRSDQVKIIFEKDEVDTNSVNIGKVFAGISYRKQGSSGRRGPRRPDLGLLDL